MDGWEKVGLYCFPKEATRCIGIEGWAKMRHPSFAFREVGGNTKDVYEVVKNRHCDTLPEKIKYVTKEFVNKMLASSERTLVFGETGKIVAQNYVL